MNMKKLGLFNPYFFWSIVVFSIVLLLVLYVQLTSSMKEAKLNSNFEKQSYSDESSQLGRYEFPEINVHLQDDNRSLLQNVFSYNNNVLLLLLLIYSIGLSFLFTYRERSRISKEMLEEKISIEKERIQSKVNIFDNVVTELQKYKQIISPELNLEDLDKKIDHDVNYILFSSRVVLEKVLLSICQKHHILEETLNSMIMVLYKKRILDPQTNGYAHTIKAFGNRVAHPNLTNPMNFSTKDALLVLSTLVALLNILESKNLINGFENV